MGRAWDVKPCAHRWALTMSSQLCHTTTGKPKAWIHKEQHALCPVSSHLYYIDFNGEGDIYFHIMCSAFTFFMILRYHLFPFTIQKDMWKNNLWTLYIYSYFIESTTAQQMSVRPSPSVTQPADWTRHTKGKLHYLQTQLVELVQREQFISANCQLL